MLNVGGWWLAAADFGDRVYGDQDFLDRVDAEQTELELSELAEEWGLVLVAAFVAAVLLVNAAVGSWRGGQNPRGGRDGWQNRARVGGNSASSSDAAQLHATELTALCTGEGGQKWRREGGDVRVLATCGAPGSVGTLALPSNDVDRLNHPSGSDVGQHFQLLSSLDLDDNDLHSLTGCPAPLPPRHRLPPPLAAAASTGGGRRREGEDQEEDEVVEEEEEGRKEEEQQEEEEEEEDEDAAADLFAARPSHPCRIETIKSLRCLSVRNNDLRSLVELAGCPQLLWLAASDNDIDSVHGLPATLRFRPPASSPHTGDELFALCAARLTHALRRERVT